MKHPFCLLSVLLLHSLLFKGYGQTITIVNEVNREPVANVALFNRDRSLATLTDTDGKANISNFKDNDSIFFQHPSFRPAVFLKHDLHEGQEIFLEKRIILIDEFVISATRTPEQRTKVPYMIDALDATGIYESLSQSSAGLLLSTGNLVVQKSQGGGGSPVLRGFEANKILLVVDGVRMNNAIYRSGHLQNSITIDNAILDRVEVIFGPTSLIYGSDALGGVIHYYTKDPVLATGKKKYTFRGTAYTSCFTASRSKTAHVDFTNGFKKIGFLTSFTWKDLGDIRMGRKKNPFYGDYGELLYYAARIHGRDTTLKNPDPFLQLNTGYRQLDLLEKIKYSPSEFFDLILNFQYSTSSRIGRYDELKNMKGDHMNYAEYYYGPQNRLLGSLKTVVKKRNLFFTNMTSTLAWQRIDEDRITRKFGAAEKRFQLEDVKVYSLNLDFLKLMNSDNRMNYGLETTFNNVASNAHYTNIYSGERSGAQTRYPDGGSYAMTSGAYVNYRFSPSKKYVFSAGTRYHYGIYHSDFIPGGILPYEDIRIANGALTGSLSMVYHPGEKWQINAIASSGFRNPNIDDYGKVRAKDGMVTVPNPGLKPEYSWNLEAGITRTIGNCLRVNATGYYTFLTNAIVRTDYQLNGKDSLFYDGDRYRIITNSNVNDAFIRGLSLNLISDLSNRLSIRGTLNFTQGRDRTEDRPLSHIPPVFGRTSVRYLFKGIATELYAEYNGWKYIEDINPYGEDNLEEATVYGFPAWYTVNFHSAIDLNHNLKLLFAVENIFDQFYKPFASGVAGAGRNFIFSLRADIDNGKRRSRRE